MEHTMRIRHALLAFVLTGLVFAAAFVYGQPPLTQTPTPAPGYTAVVVTNPVRVSQEGAWTMRVAQDGTWTMRLADQPIRTVSEDRVPSFLKSQQSYVLTWAADSRLNGQYVVRELGPEGWIRASGSDGARPRELWINTRQLAAVEAVASAR
jgi:hypothetical protein